MQLRADQLNAHLAKGLRPLYIVFGDEPLGKVGVELVGTQQHGASYSVWMAASRRSTWDAMSLCMAR